MFKPLGSELTKLVKKFHLEKKVEEQQVLTRAEKVIEDIVGLENAFPLKLKDGTLIIKCKNSTIAHHMKLSAKDIQKKVKVDSIRCIT